MLLTSHTPVSWRLAVMGVLLLLSHLGWAQEPGRTPSKKPTPTAPSQLSTQKMEEALRLLLRADSVDSQRQRLQSGPESSGLVVDQTITKIGHDFYDQFYSRWEAPAGDEDFIILISEKPSRGNNAIVTVTVNEEEILELPLQARYDFIEETAQQAIEYASAFLQQARNLSQQLERGNKQALETY